MKLIEELPGIEMVFHRYAGQEQSAGRAAGLIGLSVDPSYRRRGLALFLLSEAFRQFLRQGILHVEVQARQTNIAVLEMLRKLGFQQIEQGGVWRKE